MSTRTYYVYILSSSSRALYIGVTNDLERRVWEHRNKVRDSFTRRYNITMLVLMESYPDPLSAIAREKQLKGWSRAKKVALIEQSNPQWLNPQCRLVRVLVIGTVERYDRITCRPCHSDPVVVAGLSACCHPPARQFRPRVVRVRCRSTPDPTCHSERVEESLRRLSRLVIRRDFRHEPMTASGGR